MRRTASLAGLVTCVITLSTHGVAHGDGFRIPYQGTAAAGQAEAFAAEANDPSALQYNPAGLTQVPGVQLYMGTNLVGGHTEFTSPTGATASSDLGGSVAWPPPSHLYLTANLEDLGFDALGPLTPTAAGIGVNSPFGLVSQWPNNGPFSTVVTRASLPLLDIKPTLAYKIGNGDKLSIGLGADIYTFASFIGDGHAQLNANSAVIPGQPATEVNGNDTAAGFNVSALFTPMRNPGKDGKPGKPRLNLGVVYRSGADLDLNGTFLVNGALTSDVTTTIKLPQVVNVGVAWWPIREETHEWKVEYDMDWIGWSRFESVDFRFSNGAFPPQSRPANWNDTYTLSLGTEYKWLQLASLPRWEVALRGGYQRSQAANPSSTFDPAIPDANWNIFAAGLGLKCKEGGRFLGFINCGSSGSSAFLPKAIVLDLAFTAAVWESRAISGNILSSTINGKYETKDWYIGHVSLGLVY